MIVHEESGQQRASASSTDSTGSPREVIFVPELHVKPSRLAHVVSGCVTEASVLRRTRSVYHEPVEVQGRSARGRIWRR